MSASPACVRLSGTGQADSQSIQFLKMIACYVTSLPDKAHLLLPGAPDLVGASRFSRGQLKTCMFPILLHSTLFSTTREWMVLRLCKPFLRSSTRTIEMASSVLKL